MAFEPGKFAGDLLSTMGGADASGRAAFQSILRECSRHRAAVDFRINGVPHDPEDEAAWRQDWSRLLLTVNSRLEPDDGDEEPSIDAVMRWTGFLAAAIMALLPVQLEESEPGSAVGHEEGAAITHRATRYERDRRNRAAAIAVWGTTCQACGLDFGSRYGDVAAGFIEVHHITPVSALGSSIAIDPASDLVPLCPNCHAVAHRRVPPFSVEEIRSMLEAETDVGFQPSTESFRKG